MAAPVSFCELYSDTILLLLLLWLKKKKNTAAMPTVLPFEDGTASLTSSSVSCNMNTERAA